MEEETKFKPKEYYRNKIVEMVNSIENSEYLKKIHDYITVPYNMDKEKKRG